ncbi:MAG: PD-(D/E)XK nuclease family protein, partial [Nitrospirota bacterium]
FGFRNSAEYLLKTALRNVKDKNYSKILYLAPSFKKVADSQQRLHNLLGREYIPPEMTTIRNLSRRLYTLYGDKKVIPMQLVPVIISRICGKAIGFSSIVSNFIDEIKNYHAGKSIECITDELETIFKEHNIPDDVSQRAFQALDIFRKYEGVLLKASLVDENDVLAACPSFARMHYKNIDLIIDGFYQLTKSEELIIRALAEVSDEVLVSVPYNEKFAYITERYINFINKYFNTEEIRLSDDRKAREPFCSAYPGPEEEIEGIARIIKNYFISGTMKDLHRAGVAFPVLEKYVDITLRVFKRYGIPCNTSYARRLGMTKPFLDFIALLESIADDYPRIQFSQFLTSPYFAQLPGVFRKTVPHFCLMSGLIKGKTEWLNRLRYGGNREEMGIKPHLLSETERELKKIFKKLLSLESRKEHGNFNLFGEYIAKLLKDFGFPGGQNEDLHDQVVKLLNELSFLDSTIVSSQLTFRQFIDALKHLANSTTIEEEGIGIPIMNLSEIQAMQPDFLFIGGLRESELPSKPDMDHILPESVRTSFNLLNLQMYLSLQKFLFQRALESSDEVHLSYSVMEGDKVFLPSPFLPLNRKSRKKIHGIFSVEEELLKKGRNPLSHYMSDIADLDGRLLRNKFGRNSYIRVTDIDYFRNCPRKFFIEKVLCLQPLEIKGYEVEEKVLGTIAHDIMRNLIAMPFSSVDDLVINAEKSLENVLSKKPIEDYWKKVIRDTFLIMIPKIYEIEKRIRDDGYSLLDTEMDIEGEPVGGIKLRGKIDRIDNKNDEIELIDYKTGALQFAGARVLGKGEMLQLFLYAALMQLRGYRINRVGIYSLKDVVISWIPGRNDRKEERTLDDYIPASLHFLEDTVHKMRSGYLRADPLNEQTCWNCPERPYCPFIQKADGESRLPDRKPIHGNIS